MNANLSLIARQVERREKAKAPPPVETSGVGGAIESLIANEVERRVADALAEQRRQLEISRPAPVTSFAQLPPVPQTRAPKAIETQFARDELGRVNKILIGTMEFYVQRNELGQAVRVVPADIAPLPPVVRPAAINEV